MYLKSFTLPNAETERALLSARAAHNGGYGGYIDNPYPCGIFPKKDFQNIYFDRITIFYGGNGSGKSTLLNIISEKLQLNRIAPYNSSEMIPSYVDACSYALGDDDEGFPYRIPNGSRIISSDDIFDYMLTVRTNNNDISENKEDARKGYYDIKYGKTVKLKGFENYEELRTQVLARRKSVTRREFIRRTAGHEADLNSNGETALIYFNNKLKNDTLYCLDEPENSMSPKMQIKFVKRLEEKAYYCNCQFIIATHSPFVLAIEGAKIYDLDAYPISTKNWWQLENTKLYFEFFDMHRNLFYK